MPLALPLLGAAVALLSSASPSVFTGAFLAALELDVGVRVFLAGDSSSPLVVLGPRFFLDGVFGISAASLVVLSHISSYILEEVAWSR